MKYLFLLALLSPVVWWWMMVPPSPTECDGPAPLNPRAQADVEYALMRAEWERS